MTPMARAGGGRLDFALESNQTVWLLLQVIRLKRMTLGYCPTKNSVFGLSVLCEGTMDLFLNASLVAFSTR